jgi:two-component system, NarL family, uhpT operon response regulator UhpA
MADLTPRERQVCELVARGLSVKRVARRLDLSPSTVAVHVRNAAAKLPGEGPPRHRIIVFVLRSEG